VSYHDQVAKITDVSDRIAAFLFWIEATKR